MSMENVTSTGKDTIYIDVDDEITTLIDKVRSSHSRIVALVLPKRATVLQSIVNMKLLKHSAESSKKHLVLITSEASILPLAGSVGVYVAKTLQSKPEIPEAPMRTAEAAEEALHLDDESDETVAPPKSSVGAKSGAKPGASKATGELPKGTIADTAIDEALELDDELAEAGEDMPTKGKKAAKDTATDKKLRIPNFDKFRLLLVLGAAAFVGLIILFVICVKVLPKATISIKTNRQAINITPTLTLDTVVKTADLVKNVIPAQSQQTQKTLTGQAATTGQKNNGTKASGSVTLALNDCTSNSVTIPSGSGLTASGNLTFITQGSVTLQSVNIGGKCQNNKYQNFSTASVNVISQSAGAAYNLPSGTNFTVSGYSDVTASSSAAMSGGSDNIIQIVAQADVDAAKAKFAAVDTDAIKQQLENNLTATGSYPIPTTFTATNPAITTSANVGDQAATVTATQQVSYTMLGAKQADLQQIIKAAVDKQINASKQSIVDYGLKAATFSQQNSNATSMTLGLSGTAIVGAQLDVASIRTQVAGKKTPDATDLIKSNPGVTSVTIKYSPFWVASIPKNTSKITVEIEKPQTVSNE